MVTVVDRYLVANLPDPGQQGDVAGLDGGDVLGVGVLLGEVLSGRYQADPPWLKGRASSWWLPMITTE